MAQEHNELRQSPYGRALLNALGASEGSLERFGETLQPIVDLWSRADWAYLYGERLGAINRAVGAGGVGTNAGVALANPLVNDKLLIVEAASFASAGAAGGDTALLYLAADSSAALGSSQLCFVRDNRRGSTSPIRTTQSVVRYGNPVGIPADYDAIEARTLTTPFLYTDFKHLPIVIAPGRMVVLMLNDTDVAMNAQFSFRERAIRLTER